MIKENISIKNKDSMEYARAVFYGQEDTPRLPIGRRPVIVICPGGAYEYTSPREGDIVACQFLAMGYHAALLEYSCAPARYPVALLELATLFKTLRERAEEWHIDKDRIIVMGFSAGGHLACSLSSFWNNRGICDIIGCSADMIKPNGQILCYPVITSGRYAHEGSIRNLLGDEYEARKEEFSLEKQVNGEWRVVPVMIMETENYGWGFNDIAYELEPGSEAKLNLDWGWLYGTLTPGGYRLVKTATPDGGESVTVTAEFLLR